MVLFLVFCRIWSSPTSVSRSWSNNCTWKYIQQQQKTNFFLIFFIFPIFTIFTFVSLKRFKKERKRKELIHLFLQRYDLSAKKTTQDCQKCLYNSCHRFSLFFFLLTESIWKSRVLQILLIRYFYSNNFNFMIYDSYSCFSASPIYFCF